MQSIATPILLIFSQTTMNNSHHQNEDIEVCLNNFVRRALHITCTGEYSVDTALAILDHAWIAQKLIWSLRE